jgi:arylsulfatase A-like enzyme
MGFDSIFFADSIEHRVPQTHEIRRVVTEWLLERGERAAPVFAYFHTVVPHAPYTPNGEYRRFADASPSDLSEDSLRPYRFQLEGHIDSAQDLAHLRALYDGEVAYADAQFGLFQSMLEYFGLYDESLIVFLSDHGEEFGEHQGFGHGRTVYEEQACIPLLIKYPGGLGAGTEVVERVSTVDLVHTIGDTIGVDWSHLGLDGASLLQTAGQPQPGGVGGERTIVCETQIGAYETLRAVHSRAVFVGELKCIENLVRRDQFGHRIPRFLAFDLAADPQERQPLREDDPRLEECRTALAAFAAGGERTRGGQPDTEGADQQLLEALRALGYVE